MTSPLPKPRPQQPRPTENIPANNPNYRFYSPEKAIADKASAPPITVAASTKYKDMPSQTTVAEAPAAPVASVATTPANNLSAHQLHVLHEQHVQHVQHMANTPNKVQDRATSPSRQISTPIMRKK